ncbi:ABC transporter substrate-binding protein [Nocardia sp. NPDC005366]|uniref:ABC transporter substrate-binding protein n=1 Tax=Nocardia sp. NPDC005366 TaxID=3156878 RepID=UPI0033B9FF88
MFTPTKARLAVCLLSVALVTAACGSSDDDTSAGGSSTGAGASGAPVKIGVILPTGTQEANWPQNLAAVKAAVAGVNSRNGLGGHKVEIVYCNEKNDAAAAEACGRQIVKDDVIAVVSMFSRFGGISPQLEKAGIPSVGGLGVARDELTSPSSYFLGAQVLAFAACPAVLAEAGAAPLGMARFDVEASAVTETFAQAGAVASTGKPLAKVVATPPTTADYAPLAAQLAGADVKGVTMSLTEQASVALMQAGGDKFSYCHSDAALSDASLKGLGALGGKFSAASSTYTAQQTDKPAIKQFNDELDAAVGSDPDAAVNLRNNNQVSAWGSVHVLEEILKDKTGDLTAKTVTDALKAQTALDTGFLVAPINFSKDGPVPGLGRIVNLIQQGLQWDPAKGVFTPTGKTINIGELLAKAGG